MPFVFGFLSGVMMCLTLGTVFFALIRNSLAYGWKSGIQISLGVILCDALFITVALTGTTYLPEVPDFEVFIRVIGGLFLAIMGVLTFLSKPKGTKQTERSKVRAFLRFFVLGFTLNGANPLNFFVWAGLATVLTGERHYPFDSKVWFFGGSLLAILFTQWSIAYFAAKLSYLLSKTVLRRINQLTGIVFFATGIYILALNF